MKIRVSLLLLSVSLLGMRVSAQPRAFFQMGTLQGLNNQVGITRVPVTDASGNVKYYDVTLGFTVDSTGKLALSSSATRIVASPNLAVGSFVPGIYNGGPGHCEHTIGAPAILGGGRVSGSIADSHCLIHSERFSASWTSGPITGHPNEPALRAAGIAFQGFSWGILGDVGESWSDLGWNAGDVIGVVQAGRQLIIHNFGNDNHEDRSAVFTFCSDCV